MQKCYDSGFTHYKQSVRVVEHLEHDGEGLNLTWEVRDGIVMHSGSNVAKTLEGRVISFADRIAYINHDIDDALRAGILSPDMLPENATDVLGKTHGERINTMIGSIVRASMGKNDIMMEENVLEATDALPTFDTMENDVTVSAPSAKKNLLIGGVIGVAVSAVVVLLAFGLDKRVKSEGEISERYNLPVLAVIPEISVRRER
jgi:dGTPase